MSASKLSTFTLIMIFSHSVAAVPYNRPKFSPNAIWNPNATTFASSSTALTPYAIFINKNDTAFVTSRDDSQVIIWSKGNSTPTKIISGGVSYPVGLFVTDDDSIYVDNGEINNRIDMRMPNGTLITDIMSIPTRCFDIFVDDNNTLYCSADHAHKVLKMSLNDPAKLVITVAGDGTIGSGPYRLFYPNGILVDQDYNLYVADAWNDRIQFFRRGQLNGSTISTAPYLLDNPGDIICDADGYLFIADLFHNRVIGSGVGGYRCIAGCSLVAGATADRLNAPVGLSFDTAGNLFVVDRDNRRIQKFLAGIKPNITGTTTVSTTRTTSKVSTSVRTSSSTQSTSISTTTSSRGMLIKENSGLYALMCLMIFILGQ